MPKASFAERISESEVMVAGIKSHKDELIEKGRISEQLLTEYDELLKATTTLNNEQERMKADLGSKTDEIVENLDELNRMHQHFKRVVMNNVPKPQWVEFGMRYRPRKPNSDSEPDDTPDDTNPGNDNNDNPPPPLPPAAEAEELKDIF